jgi:hypothetical protein
MIDLNHASGFNYEISRSGELPDRTTARINAHVDAALIARNRQQRPRDYLGGSRVGEPCARKLVYEISHASKDPGRDFDGRILRTFDAGHQFEALTIRWLRFAGFDLRDRNVGGEQLSFTSAEGKLRGHVDGVIVAGPDVGICGPLFLSTRPLTQSPGMTLLSVVSDDPSRSTSLKFKSTWPT